MTTATNGTTKKKRRKDGNSFLSDTSEALGGIESTSGINGTQQDGSNFEHCRGQNISQQSNGGNSSSGKILTRLKQLESEYLSYVGEHQQRLEARLDESKEREVKFKQAIRELEQEIQSLMSGNSE